MNKLTLRLLDEVGEETTYQGYNSINVPNTKELWRKNPRKSLEYVNKTILSFPLNTGEGIHRIKFISVEQNGECIWMTELTAYFDCTLGWIPEFMIGHFNIENVKLI